MELAVNTLLVILGASGVILYMISTIFIYDFLKRRNDKTPHFLFINFHIFEFVDKYKRLTKGTNRKIGGWYFLWIISINIALLCAILLFVINVLIR